jgi:cytochrome c oxidase subunit 3
VNGPAIDVRALPDHRFGPGGLIWWGTAGYMVIEATMFAMVVAAYGVLRYRSPEWPPGLQPPDPLPGALNAVVLLVSLVPNWFTKRAAERYDLAAVRRLLPVMLGLALVALVIRVFEFPALRCRWDDNAYASVVWALLSLHTLHLATDAYDTAVLTAVMARHPEPKRFVDVSENALYWIFIVLSWVPLFAVIAGGARWL